MYVYAWVYGDTLIIVIKKKPERKKKRRKQKIVNLHYPIIFLMCFCFVSLRASHSLTLSLYK